MVMDPDRKEFLLHLYDKLWENIVAKENRVWTFLSFYGAALALSLAAGRYAGNYELFVVIVVNGLTVWAALIILNANWWYYRNQLMVTRVEAQFEDAVAGVVPISYRDPRYALDPLHRYSMLILATLSILLFAKAMWRYGRPSSIDSSVAFFGVVLLYGIFSLAVWVVLREHERSIRKYYGAKLNLLLEAERAKTSGQKVRQEVERELLPQERQSRQTVNGRWLALFLFAVASGLFDFAAWHNGGWWSYWVMGGMFGQVMLAGGYVRWTRKFLSEEISEATLGDYHLETVEIGGRAYGRARVVAIVIVFMVSLVSVSVGVVLGNPQLKGEFAELVAGSRDGVKERLEVC